MGGGAGNSGWMEKLGWMEVVGVVTPVNGEQGVNRLGTSRLEVVGVDGMDGVNFQLSSGFHMTGFYGDLGWLHQRQVKPQDKRFWGVLEGVGTRYRVQTVDSLGILGWMVVTVVITMVLVAG